MVHNEGFSDTILDSNPPDEHNIADPGTEEMWIEADGTPYAYYTGPDDRCYNVYCPKHGRWQSIKW